MGATPGPAAPRRRLANTSRLGGAKGLPAQLRAGLGTPAFAGVVERIFTELYPLFIFTSVVAPKWETEIKKALK